jgi:MOSC domain-containing protein YiiM
MQTIPHRGDVELAAALESIRAAPRDVGVIEMIVRRPAIDAREVLEEAVLDPAVGLVGDTWNVRPSSKTPDRSPHPEKQVTLMGSRAVAAVAGAREHWPLAGDQLFVDLDLGLANLPPGTRLGVGTAVLEVSAAPHTGCAKFAARFGSAASRWLNTPEGRALNLRGINAKVVTGGVVRRGDIIKKINGGAVLAESQGSQ